MKCYCGSKKNYSNCCEPFHKYQQLPETPEALMRSRYAAYCRADIKYIEKTMQGKAAERFNATSATQWAERVIWISLQIINTSMQNNFEGKVEFIAKFVDNKTLQQFHEISDFQRINDQWYYIDGHQMVSESKDFEASLSRNSKCPCDSSKKWKHCHGKMIMPR